jgi:hypothetical protein
VGWHRGQGRVADQQPPADGVVESLADGGVHILHGPRTNPAYQQLLVKGIEHGRGELLQRHLADRGKQVRIDLSLVLDPGPGPHTSLSGWEPLATQVLGHGRLVRGYVSAALEGAEQLGAGLLAARLVR